MHAPRNKQSEGENLVKRTPNRGSRKWGNRTGGRRKDVWGGKAGEGCTDKRFEKTNIIAKSNQLERVVITQDPSNK